MSCAEILAQIPRLTHADRREIMRRIMEAEEDAATLAECDRLALERFQMRAKAEIGKAETRNRKAERGQTAG